MPQETPPKRLRLLNSGDSKGLPLALELWGAPRWKSGGAISQDFTTNKTLEDEARRLGIPLNYCWHKTSFPRPTQDGGYIINLADEGKAGTHWTALWREGNEFVYFDSFGFVPPLEVEAQLPKYLYNATIIQDWEFGGCGSYCIEFLQYMNEHGAVPLRKRFQDFLNLFHQNYRKNRAVLRRLEQD